MPLASAALLAIVAVIALSEVFDYVTVISAAVLGLSACSGL